MNFPSSINPNPSSFSSDFGGENLGFDIYDFPDLFFMIEEDPFNRDDSTSTSTRSMTSEKVTAEGTSSPAASVTTSSSKNPDELIGGRDGSMKRKKTPEDAPIHVFRTKSSSDILDDGFKWRKYGKKPIKGSPFPRHYHKCSNPDCGVKKQTERDRANPEFLLTTYEGMHNHGSPSIIYCDIGDLISPNILSFKQDRPNHSRSAP